VPSLDVSVNLHTVLVDSLNASEALDGEQKVLLELLAVAIVVVLVIVKVVDIVLLPQLANKPDVFQVLLVH
jgi:hypothetical protein